MAAGPGKYGAECEAALRDTGAVACILIVIEGDRGTGLTMLEMMAADIRADAGRPHHSHRAPRVHRRRAAARHREVPACEVTR